MSELSVAPLRRTSRRAVGVAAAAGVGLSTLIAPATAAFDPPEAEVFVSEIHYDNVGDRCR